MWDIFISHASENKDSLARVLAQKLSEVYKVNVWYDEFSLEYGDSLLDSIEKGLQNSKFGVVIFSKEFFNKMWTDHEYKSLKTKEMLLSKKVIIPVWYNITREEIAKYSLTLADKFAINITNNFDINELAIKIVKVVRPDIYDNISRINYFEQQVESGIEASVDVKDISNITIPPIRHEKLSIQMKARLKLIYNAIKNVDKRSYYEYEKDFRRSVNIDREIIITELLTAAYIDCISKRKMTNREKLDVYALVMSSGKFKMRLSISYEEQQKFISIIRNYIKDINSDIVMEYKFE